jgi:hypothetical protein
LRKTTLVVLSGLNSLDRVAGFIEAGAGPLVTSER